MSVIYGFETEAAARAFVTPLLRLMPTPNAWAVRVHENDGWHVSLEFTARRSLVHLYPETCDGKTVEYWWCLIGAEMGGAPALWVPEGSKHFKDPIRCLRHTLRHIRNVVEDDTRRLELCEKCLEG